MSSNTEALEFIEKLTFFYGYLIFLAVFIAPHLDTPAGLLSTFPPDIYFVLISLRCLVVFTQQIALLGYRIVEKVGKTKLGCFAVFIPLALFGHH